LAPYLNRLINVYRILTIAQRESESKGFRAAGSFKEEGTSSKTETSNLSEQDRARETSKTASSRDLSLAQA